MYISGLLKAGFAKQITSCSAARKLKLGVLMQEEAAGKPHSIAFVFK